MSEEIRDASITLPRAIMGSVILNVTLVFTVIITICFTLGDPDDVLASPTGYAFIQIFYNATNSLAGTSVMTFIIIFMLSVCAVSEAAACSRQIWSFARDKGLPGHSWLSKVSPHWNIPLPGIIVSLSISPLDAQKGPNFDNELQVLALPDGQRLFITDDGRIGLGPAAMRAGDDVKLLPETFMPMVLRSQDIFYQLVGGCYIAGLMDLGSDELLEVCRDLAVEEVEIR